MDVIFTILYGIVGSLIASFMFELLRAKSSWFPGPSESTDYKENVSDSNGAIDERQVNRAKLHWAFFNIFFYCYTFFIVYAAIVFPPLVKSIFSGGDVYLDNARIIGEFLPSVQIGTDFVQIWSVIVTVAIYIPLLLIVSRLAVPLSHIIDKFYKVDIYRWKQIQTLLFISFSAVLAIFSIYIFNNGTLKDSAITLLGFIVVSFLFSKAGKA
ncbi:TPA: hypothetical protein ACPYU1_004096 [Raoultella planticola]